MHKIGLTGGIACGKSSVATILKTLGIPVLDADQVARDVVAPNTLGLQEIVAHFGTEILLEDGSLNRQALRRRMIQNPTDKTTLESITHPKIFQAMQIWQAEQEKAGHSHTVVEAALMVETGSYRLYDALIVVGCREDIQIERLMHRNTIGETEAKQWIATQFPLSQKRDVATITIENNGSPEELRTKTIEMWTHLLSLLSR